MTSKHNLRQTRWQIDQHGELATHDNGLRVRFANGQGIAENSDEIVQLLAPQHGLHNATAMVQRLVREGAQLLVDPNARGWRNS